MDKEDFDKRAAMGWQCYCLVKKNMCTECKKIPCTRCGTMVPKQILENQLQLICVNCDIETNDWIEPQQADTVE